MPIFDRRCTACQALKEDCYERHDAEAPICACGGTMARVWLGAAAHVVDDSWPGGKYFEHLSHRGETFYSRSEYTRFLRATGQMEYVRHQGKPGSDRSPHTTRWV